MTNNIMYSKESCLTPIQAAEVLNVSLSTLKKLIYSGKISTFKTPGGHHRITRSSLQHFEVTASQVHNFEKEEERCLPEIIEGFIKITEEKLKFGKNHSNSTANLSVLIGQKMGFSSEQLHNIKLAGLLHDIGKVNIDHNILNKITPLTAEEYNMVKRHSLIGFDILSSIQPFKHLAYIIRQHHEKYDGSGYPEGLKKKEICIEARIISITESFDTMTSADSYRKPLAVNIALDKIKESAGTYFDPEVTLEFLQLAKHDFAEVIK